MEKQLTGKEIAFKAGISQVHFSRIRHGKRRPSPQLAAKLAEITGIPETHWLWPDKYPNPMIQLESKEN